MSDQYPKIVKWILHFDGGIKNEYDISTRDKNNCPAPIAEQTAAIKIEAVTEDGKVNTVKLG